MPTNDQRASLARDACQVYADADGLSMDEELPTVISDLIANLLHLADQTGLCPESAVDTALMHFNAEKDEEDDCYADD